MSKHVPFSRDQFRRQRRAFLRRNWGGLTIVAVILAAIAVLTTWLADGYLLGALHATLLVSCGAMVLVVFFATNPRTLGQLAGAWGEDQTVDVLKKARRRRLIWGWVDGVATASGDIDHFVITRMGGLVAIDSKWRNDFTSRGLENDAHAARAAARRADSILRSLDVPVGITPLIVVWGGARHEVPDKANVSGVDFIQGERLLEWLGRLSHEPVDEPSARELEKRLKEFRARVRPRAKAH